MLLAFPVPQIWKLRMQRSQKIMLTSTFAWGGLYVVVFSASSPRLCYTRNLKMSADKLSESSVTVASIVRFIYLCETNPPPVNFTLAYTKFFIWTNIEVNISIICGQYMKAVPTQSYETMKSAKIWIFGTATSMPALPPPYTIVHLRADSTTTKTREYS